MYDVTHSVCVYSGRKCKPTVKRSRLMFTKPQSEKKKKPGGGGNRKTKNSVHSVALLDNSSEAHSCFDMCVTLSSRHSCTTAAVVKQRDCVSGEGEGKPRIH